jgi:hypothetical protein
MMERMNNADFHKFLTEFSDAVAQGKYKKMPYDKYRELRKIKNSTVDISVNTYTNHREERVSRIIVSLHGPVGYEFDMVDIDAGAGDISVSRLTAKRLDADLGAGDTYLNFLTVTDEADIDGGVGILSISNAEITDLDLDLGVGYFSFHGIMNGNNTISFGVGESLVDFYDDKERYYFDVDKGIGEIEYYGTEDFNFVRSGQETTVRLEEGIGKITVRFFDKIDNER